MIRNFVMVCGLGSISERARHPRGRRGTKRLGRMDRGTGECGPEPRGCGRTPRGGGMAGSSRQGPTNPSFLRGLTAAGPRTRGPARVVGDAGAALFSVRAGSGSAMLRPCVLSRQRRTHPSIGWLRWSNIEGRTRQHRQHLLGRWPLNAARVQHPPRGALGLEFRFGVVRVQESRYCTSAEMQRGRGGRT